MMWLLLSTPHTHCTLLKYLRCSALGDSSRVGTLATVGTSQAPVSRMPPSQNRLVVPGLSLQ
eukprot:2928303-Rhodomonas_salina.1